MKKNKDLAFVVTEEYAEGTSCVVFERSNVAARRIGANELNSEFEYVTCRREPILDQFAEKGKVPSRFLIENLDWWFTCSECGNRAPNMDDDGKELDPEYDGDLVFCNRGCKKEYKDGIRRRNLLMSERKAACLREFPNSEVLHVSNHESDATVTFRFSGGKSLARWIVGEDVVRVSQEDLAAFEAYKKTIPALKEKSLGGGLNNQGDV